MIGRTMEVLLEWVRYNYKASGGVEDYNCAKPRVRIGYRNWDLRGDENPPPLGVTAKADGSGFFSQTQSPFSVKFLAAKGSTCAGYSVVTEYRFRFATNEYGLARMTDYDICYGLSQDDPGSPGYISGVSLLKGPCWVHGSALKGGQITFEQAPSVQAELPRIQNSAQGQPGPKLAGSDTRAIEYNESTTLPAKQGLPTTSLDFEDSYLHAHIDSQDDWVKDTWLQRQVAYKDPKYTPPPYFLGPRYSTVYPALSVTKKFSMLADFTGDGLPDYVYPANGRLNLRRNTTRFEGKITFAADQPLFGHSFIEDSDAHEPEVLAYSATMDIASALSYGVSGLPTSQSKRCSSSAT